MKLGMAAACVGIAFAFFALVAFSSAQAAERATASQRPASIRVHVRIEGPDRTLFNGVVATRPASFTTQPVAGTACDSLSVRSFAPTAPSPVTALNDALAVASVGFWSDPTAFTYGDQVVGTRGLAPGVKPFSYGPEVCRIGRYVNDDARGAGWRLKINNVNAFPSGAVSPTSQIGHGATVVWYWSEPDTKRTLDIKLPQRAIVGKRVNGHVDAWDNATNRRVDAKNVAVGGPTGMIKAATGGDFSLRLRSPGLHVISTAASGSARGSDVICIYKRRSGECNTRLRRR
jgi:hypothetical protein